MALRPGRTVRKVERPYTRVSQKVPRKSYVVGVPVPKLHHFEMGNKNGNFSLALYLVSEQAAQIRHNALEAGRIVANKFLDSKVGSQNYFMKILKFPHHVVREKPIATGAGADRYSRGMAQAFGRPTGTAVQVKPGDRLVMIKTNKEFLGTAKKALKKFGLKLPVRISILIEQ